MYVEAVPNRSSPPAILLRESWREGAKIRKRTLANLSHWPAPRVELLRRLLRGDTLLAPSDALAVTRSLPHGHVAAVLGTLKKLRLDKILHARPSRQRDLVVAMIVARVLEPRSKLATARGLRDATAASSLGGLLALSDADEDELYQAMDWLLPRQAAIEKALAKQHLEDGSLVLYDLSSTYFEGRKCPLARFGYSRDERPANPQIVFGLLTDSAGRPLAVEVFEGNTSDPATVAAQIDKLRRRFALERIVLVGDRGMLTSARIREDLAPAAVDWISALKSSQIQKLAVDGALQMSLFDERDLAEITHPSYPSERLIACRNPLLADERRRKREELLRATEKKLDKIVAATARARRPLRGAEAIALAAGKTLGRSKMAKHFRLQIEDDRFGYRRDPATIEREAALDGVYVIRTSLAEERCSAPQAVRRYKSLAAVERAFRSLKSVDLKVRPIHHHVADRVRAHVLLAMLAYYVEWHMRRALAPLLFDDEDREAAARRDSPVAKAVRSPQAERKAQTRRTAEGLPAHSFQTLLADLATLSRNRVRLGEQELDMLTAPTPLQQRAFELLGLRP